VNEMSSLEERVIEEYKITEPRRECDGCGEVKPDVMFRAWNTFDGSEWEFLCASCAERKQQNADYFSVSFTLWGIAIFAVFIGLICFVVF